MHIVLVHVHVNPKHIDAFRSATLLNAQNSVLEEGVARFDVLQSKDDPAFFTLIEVYRDMDAPAKHKETAHYQAWRETVADMMAQPRQGVPYSNIFPGDEGWI
jgi:quinol monooxygenase YgiN